MCLLIFFSGYKYSQEVTQEKVDEVINQGGISNLIKYIESNNLEAEVSKDYFKQLKISVKKSKTSLKLIATGKIPPEEAVFSGQSILNSFFEEYDFNQLLTSAIFAEDKALMDLALENGALISFKETLMAGLLEKSENIDFIIKNSPDPLYALVSIIRFGNKELREKYLQKYEKSLQGEHVLGFAAYNAVSSGDKENIQYFLNKIASLKDNKDIDQERLPYIYLEAARGAAETGDLNTLQQILPKIKTFESNLVNAAASEGNLHIVEFLFKHLKEENRLTEDDTNDALFGAAQGGHDKIINYAIKNGAKDFNQAQAHASKGGHLKLVKTFEKLGANNFEESFAKASTNGNVDLLEYLRLKLPEDTNLHTVFEKVTEDFDVNALEYLMDLGINDFEFLLIYSAENSNLKLINRAILNGAENFSVASTFLPNKFFEILLQLYSLQKINAEKQITLNKEDVCYNVELKQNIFFKFMPDLKKFSPHVKALKYFKENNQYSKKALLDLEQLLDNKKNSHLAQCKINPELINRISFKLCKKFQAANIDLQASLKKNDELVSLEDFSNNKKISELASQDSTVDLYIKILTNSQLRLPNTFTEHELFDSFKSTTGKKGCGFMNSWAYNALAGKDMLKPKVPSVINEGKLPNKAH